MAGIGVETDHQIVGFGIDRMVLFDAASGAAIAEANRVNGEWVIHADGVADVTVPVDIQPGPTFRQGAITAMVDHALAALPGDGYSCVVPPGLAEMP